MNQEDKIKEQFGMRVSTFNSAANWMLNKDLINAHISVAPNPTEDNNKCLDLCCGTGIIGKAFKKAGWKVTGIDITPEMVEEACKDINAIEANIDDLPFEDNSFDIAVLRQSYKLINGPKALKELRRILKKDGVFILGQSIAFSKVDEPHYYKIQKTRHINMINYYKKEDFIKELTENLFQVEDIKYLRIQESVDKWLKHAMALDNIQRNKIIALIKNAPNSYKELRRVQIKDGELFEDWNWAIFKCRVLK